jgi:hypothetical protein
MIVGYARTSGCIVEPSAGIRLQPDGVRMEQYSPLL